MPDASEPDGATIQRLLALELPPNDSAATTVRGYLTALLAALWREQDEFSGKRPFGNSGWDYDIYMPMIKAGFIRGSFDEEGYVEDIDDKAAERLILAAIEAMGVQP